MNTQAIAHLTSELENVDTPEALNKVATIYADKRMVFSSSLGAEDQVLTDIIIRNNLPIEILTLDTDMLFPETYDLIERSEKKYGTSIVRFFAKEDLVNQYIQQVGKFGFYDSVENRKRCCFIRKIEPLNRALKNADVWITGLSRYQSPSRQQLVKFEWDDRQILKFNPLVDWTREDIWQYIRRHDVPYNALHDRNHPSIGCAPCTRAITASEDERSGRWWWENADTSKQECGLHTHEAHKMIDSENPT